MTGSIFAGFLKYPKTDRQTPLENQTTELLAAILRRSRPLCREFVSFLCEEAGLQELNEDTLEDVEFKVSTQELARWDNQIGFIDMVIRGFKADDPYIYVCVEVKVDACLHEREVDNDENKSEEISLQIHGYEKYVEEEKSAFTHKLVGVLAKRKSLWQPRLVSSAYDAIWLSWALRLRVFLQKETDPISRFLAKQFLMYMKEGGISVTGPFTFSEFGGVRDFLSFWEKLNLVMDPIQRLKLPNRQIVRVFDENGIQFRSDIHWQWLKAGIRFEDETSALPEFYVELELGNGKKNKLSLISDLGKEFTKHHPSWKDVSDGEMTYLKKSEFKPGWLTDKENIYQIQSWFSECVNQLEDSNFNFLERFKEIVEK